VLVNDIWAAKFQRRPAEWNTPIWEHDLDKVYESPARYRHHLITLITSPMLVDKPWLLVEVTDAGRLQLVALPLSVFYDLAKVAVNRLAFSRTRARTARTTAVAITPDFSARR